MIKRVFHFFLAIFLASAVVSAGSFTLGSSNDNLELTEVLGDVIKTISEAELSDLATINVKTNEGSTDVKQYIRFEDTATSISSPSVRLDKSNDNEVDIFLKFDQGTSVTDAFLEYHMEFSEGLQSKISGDVLKNLDGIKLNILGDEYLIVEGTVTGSALKLVLASGAINDFLQTGEKKEYMIGTDKYEVSIKTIETSSKSVVFTINGNDLQKLQKSETFDLGSGMTLGVTDVLPSSGGNDFVQFYIGAKILQFEDTSYSDNSFNKGVKLNKQKLSDSFVQLSATLVGDVLKISDIKYRLTIRDEIYLKSGESLAQYIFEPKALLGNLDLRFGGLNIPSSSKISFIPSGDDEYILTFSNAGGTIISVPFVSNKGSFKYGDDDQDLVFIEGSGLTDYNVNVDDYFVLTSANDKTGKTYVLKYDSIDTSTQTLHLSELGGSTLSLQYSNASGNLGEVDLTVGSVNAKVYIEDAAGNKLVIDQNGDGDIASDEMNLVVFGGGILDIGSSNSLSGSSLAVTLTTDDSQLEESTTDETTTITIDTTLGTKIGIQSSFTGLTTKKTKSNHVIGITNFGAYFNLDDPQGQADSLDIAYPQTQAFASVSLEASSTGSVIQTSVQSIKVTTCSNEKQDGDETGVDCGGSCTPCISCSDGIKNQGEEGIDCGGPCGAVCSEEVKEAECSSGCLQLLEDGSKNCLSVGTIIEERFCAVDQSLKVQMKNGMTCTADYECLSSKCLDGSCGRKVSIVKIIVNVMVLLIIFGMFWYGFKLMKKESP